MFLTLHLQFHAVMMMHAHWEVLPVLQAFEMIVLPSCGYKKELISSSGKAQRNWDGGREHAARAGAGLQLDLFCNQLPCKCA